MTTETLNTEAVEAQAAKLTSQRMALYVSGLTFAVVLFLAGVVMSLSGDVKVMQYRLDTIDKKMDAFDKKLDAVLKAVKP